MPAFVCTPQLAAYMQKKGKRILCVEVAQSNTSDIEIAEPFLRLIDEKQAAYLQEKKRYRRRPLEGVEDGEVLLAPYNLTMDERVVFDRKKILFFHMMRMEGIRL